MSVAENKKYEELFKFFDNYYDLRKYLVYLKFFENLKFKVFSVKYRKFEFLEVPKKEQLFDLKKKKNILIEFENFFKEKNKIKEKIELCLKEIDELLSEIEIHEEYKRKMYQEYLIKKKCRENYDIRKKKFYSFEMKNSDDPDNFRESQLKLIEEEKEKKIKESNEKYKNIMDKLDLIKNREEFYEFLKTLKLN
jgi:hypothetical protein